MGEVEFAVLGPIAVLRGGTPLRLSSSKQRLLLGLLLSHPDEALTVDFLIEGLWSAHPPATAPGVLQSYVSQLRKLVERSDRASGDSRVLLRTEGGYRLLVPAEGLDASRFERLTKAGRTALGGGRPVEAVEALNAALSLWRGPAFGELGHEPAILPAAQRLDDLRALAAELRIDAMMAQGGHREAVGELEALVSAHPLRERCWGQLMVCLYRSNRQAEALAHYQRLRRHLADELGIEPSAELQRLEGDILRHAPQLDWTDLSGTEHLYQVRADGLRAHFPPPRTLDAVPGNLTTQPTSFLGRDTEVKAVIELVQTQRLVTLTGIGGVGKTRLALHVAAALAAEFPDGVWLVELAPVSEGSSVPAAFAGALQTTPQPGLTITEHLAQALATRRALIVVDNCEHVLREAGDLLDAILTASATVKLLATSREGLGLAAEQLWPVQPFDVGAGTASTAVELFVERTRAVLPDFEIRTPADATAVTEICRRLDGIALAIELAAARMVSLSPTDIRDRLDDRFRLLGGPRRGAVRHQTLQNVVQWSVDLLERDEQTILARCSVFADGFALQDATAVCGQPAPGGRHDGHVIDEFVMLDLLDSLVRKSLITVDRSGEQVRYRMLETIRQFGEQQLALSGTAEEAGDRHAAYFGERAVRCWTTRDGGELLAALDFLEPNLANLRAGFRWAVNRNQPAVATAIAAHAALLLFQRQLTEPIGWAEELVPAAIAADVAQLPRLLIGAALRAYTGNVPDALRYSELAMKLEGDPRYDAFEYGWASISHANARLFNGEPERWLEICSELARSTGMARRIGLAGLLNGLPGRGRGEQARALADKALIAVRQTGDPFWVSFAMLGYGRAFEDTDPARALGVLREAVDYTREHRMTFWEAVITREAASIEGLHGDPATALELFERAIASQHRAMNVAHIAAALASLAVLVARLGEPETAATIYGSTTPHGSANRVKGLGRACANIEAALGPQRFEECVARGAAMATAEAVHHALEQIRTLRARVQTVGQ